MNRTLYPLAVVALSLATSMAIAQTPTPPTAPPPDPAAPQSQPVPPHQPPPQVTPVPENAPIPANQPLPGRAQPPLPPITPFEMLDRSETGKLTKDQAMSDPWLTQNFVRCDGNHNDEVTESEYEKCKAR